MGWQKVALVVFSKCRLCVLGLQLIQPLKPHQIPYPTPRIFNIAIPSWDQVNMTMEDGLAGVCALVDANVKSSNRWV